MKPTLSLSLLMALALLLPGEADAFLGRVLAGVARTHTGRLGRLASRGQGWVQRIAGRPYGYGDDALEGFLRRGAGTRLPGGQVVPRPTTVGRGDALTDLPQDLTRVLPRTSPYARVQVGDQSTAVLLDDGSVGGLRRALDGVEAATGRRARITEVGSRYDSPWLRDAPDLAIQGRVGREALDALPDTASAFDVYRIGALGQ